MNLFGTIFQKLLPLYFVVFLGYLAAKKFQVKKESVAALLLYFISPCVVFSGVYHAQNSGRLFGLTALFYFLCAFIALLSYGVGRYFLDKPTTGIFSMGAGNCNSGYFGLPVAFALFGESGMNIVIFLSFGFVLHEATLGFFLAARGKYTARESVKKLLRLPIVHAVLLAVIVKSANLSLSAGFEDFLIHMRGCYSVLGMMVIGLGVADQKSFEKDIPYLLSTIVAKFVVWPVVVFAVIVADVHYFHVFDAQYHQVMWLMALLPMAANTVTIATDLKSVPSKAALAVLISTFLSWISLPFAVGWHP